MKQRKKQRKETHAEEGKLGWPANELRLKATEQSLKSMYHCLTLFCLYLASSSDSWYAGHNPKVKKTHGKAETEKCYFKPLKLWAFSHKTAQATQGQHNSHASECKCIFAYGGVMSQ